MKSGISIIIPTFNNISGLRYLLNYFKNKDYQVIVVDNNHNVKKLTGLRVNELKNLIYLPQEKNLGFAAAINLGAKYVKSKWMLILNDDVIFEYQISNINPALREGRGKYQKYISKIKYFKNPLERLINFAEKNKLEAVSPILINPSGEIENVGYKVLSYGKIKLVKKLTSLRVNELEGLTAACLLIKTDIFKKLEGFDESFFAYLEDVDFFLRFKKKGYKMAIAPFYVFHHHMTTSKTMANFKARQDMINWWRLYFKHPDVFNFDFKFLVERLKNLSGYIKSLMKIGIN
ncbi:MAG: glycosyltransferase family 2 protein [Microgenomates group bacterium]